MENLKTTTETGERNGDNSHSIAHSLPKPPVPTNGVGDSSGDDMHQEGSPLPLEFKSMAKMIGLEDPEDVQPYLDTMTHLQLVISNLECFKFTEQRKTAMKKMLEDIRQRLEE